MHGQVFKKGFNVSVNSYVTSGLGNFEMIGWFVIKIIQLAWDYQFNHFLLVAFLREPIFLTQIIKPLTKSISWTISHSLQIYFDMVMCFLRLLSTLLTSPLTNNLTSLMWTTAHKGIHINFKHMIYFVAPAGLIFTFTELFTFGTPFQTLK